MKLALFYLLCFISGIVTYVLLTGDIHIETETHVQSTIEDARASL